MEAVAARPGPWDRRSRRNPEDGPQKQSASMELTLSHGDYRNAGAWPHINGCLQHCNPKLHKACLQLRRLRGPRNPAVTLGSLGWRFPAPKWCLAGGWGERGAASVALLGALRAAAINAACTEDGGASGEAQRIAAPITLCCPLITLCCPRSLVRVPQRCPRPGRARAASMWRDSGKVSCETGLPRRASWPKAILESQ